MNLQLSTARQSLLEVHQLLGKKKPIQALERALELEKIYPQEPAIHVAKTFAYVDQGMEEQARESIRTALELGANSAHGITEALIAPEVPESEQEIQIFWNACNRKILELRQVQGRVPSPVAFYSRLLHFRFSYYGYNVRNLYRQLAELYLHFSPGLAFQAPYIEDSSLRGARPMRIGVILSFGSAHAMGRAFKGTISNLVHAGFNVHVFTTRRDAVIPEFEKITTAIPYNLGGARQEIAQFQPDILLFTEIGMDPLTYFLSFSRMAKFQCVLSGHPVTTGVPNIDYYIASGLAEPIDGHEHYTEELIRLNGIPSSSLPDAAPETSHELDSIFTRNPGCRIYYCPLIYFKLHPAFDKTLRRILEADSKAILLMWGSKMKGAPEKLARRFSQTLSEHASRVLYHPLLASRHFLALLEKVDVVLDNPYFGLGTTAMYALKSGAPVITEAGSFLRSGSAAALYRRIGMPELIADNTDEYIASAISTAASKDKNIQLRSAIRSRAHMALNDTGFGEGLVDFFNNLPVRGTV